MITAALQSELEAVEPALTDLAQKLGQSPETILREAVEAKKKEWAMKKLDQAVAEAEASGFSPYTPGKLVEEVRERVMKRREQNQA